MSPGEAGGPEPVARVLVDTGLAHLDRPFEYLVSAELDESCRPGCRVKVRFAGKDLDGYVTQRTAQAEHAGRLTPLRRVVSPEPVLMPRVLAAAQTVARHYGGSTGDVLRLAVPPRVAAAEKALPLDPPDAPEPTGDGPCGDGPGDASGEAGPLGAWARYPAGGALLQRVEEGEHPWAAWLAAPSAAEPGQDWPAALADLAAAALAGGRGALLLVPDHRDVARVEAEVAGRLGPGRHVRLTAEQGPHARYTAWLKVLRGHVQVVVGTRAAAWAPVRDLGVIAVWDEGDDLWQEPRAPYPHTREVAAARARLEQAALVLGGFARTPELQSWVDSAVCVDLGPDRERLRRHAPRVLLAGEGVEADRDPAARSARLPSVALRAAREGLEAGPVLVQVPRRGYVPALRCQSCRERAACARCHGPLGLVGARAEPTCRWCGRSAAPWECPACGGRQLRASRVGAARTAEELGRALPGVPVVTSGAGEVLAAVPSSPALVVATPGAEPVAEGGYAAVLLLDAWALLDRTGLDVPEEALRRWLGAAALARGISEGGTVVLAGAPQGAHPVVEALVRWAPQWLAARELQERAALGLPPAARMAQLAGEGADLRALVPELARDLPVTVLGPMSPPPGAVPLRLRGQGERGPASVEQVLVSVPRHAGDALALRLQQIRAERSARKASGPLLVRVDPQDALG